MRQKSRKEIEKYEVEKFSKVINLLLKNVYQSNRLKLFFHFGESDKNPLLKIKKVSKYIWKNQ